MATFPASRILGGIWDSEITYNWGYDSAIIPGPCMGPANYR